MAIALIVQDVNASTTPSGSSAITTITSSTAGSLLVLTIHIQSSSTTITGVTDSQSNTWTKAVDLSTSGSYTGIWYLANAPAGITSVTATESVGTGFSSNVSQWSGAATSSPVRATNSTAVITSPNRTGTVTSTAGDLVIGSISANSATARTLTGAFSPLTTGALPAGFTALQAYYLTPGGTDEAQWTTASTANTGGVIVDFMPSGASLSGAATVSATASISATATTNQPAAATAAVAVGLTASATRIAPVAAATTATVSVVAAATTAQPGAAAVACSVVVVASATVVTPSGPVIRPDTGTVARPGAGVVIRPDTGTVIRP